MVHQLIKCSVAFGLLSVLTKRMIRPYSPTLIGASAGYAFSLCLSVSVSLPIPNGLYIINWFNSVPLPPPQCIVESSSASFCYGELLQIYHCLVRTQNTMATQQVCKLYIIFADYVPGDGGQYLLIVCVCALICVPLQATYTALNRTKQALMITDDHLRIQFTNKAMERLLSARPDEVHSRPTSEFFHSDLSALQSQIARGREFDGMLSLRRKCTDPAAVHVHAIPVYCIGK